MSFNQLLKDKFTVYRPAFNKRSYSILATGVFGFLQEKVADDQQIQGDDFGNGYTLFLDNKANVRTGDKWVRASDSLELRVTGVKLIDYGSFPHYELDMIRDNSLVTYTT